MDVQLVHNTPSVVINCLITHMECFGDFLSSTSKRNEFQYFKLSLC